MIFGFNLQGLAIVILSFIFYFMFKSFLPSGGASNIFFGSFMIVSDLLTRYVILKKFYKGKKMDDWPFFIFPVIVIGAILLAIGLYNLFK